MATIDDDPKLYFDVFTAQAKLDLQYIKERARIEEHVRRVNMDPENRPYRNQSSLTMDFMIGLLGIGSVLFLAMTTVLFLKGTTLISFVSTAGILLYLTMIVWYCRCICVTKGDKEYMERKVISGTTDAPPALSAISLSEICKYIHAVSFDRHLWYRFSLRDPRKLYSGHLLRQLIINELGGQGEQSAGQQAQQLGQAPKIGQPFTTFQGGVPMRKGNPNVSVPKPGLTP